MRMNWDWDVFRGMDALRREIDRVFDHAGLDWAAHWASFLPGRAARRYPLLNVSEDPETVHVEALAPGLDPESLEVTVQGDTLTLAGEKKPLAEVPAEAYHRNERATGRFVRTLSLDTDINDKKVAAEYRDGILRVMLPKAESARPKKIAVKVN